MNLTEISEPFCATLVLQRRLENSLWITVKSSHILPKHFAQAKRNQRRLPRGRLCWSCTGLFTENTDISAWSKFVSKTSQRFFTPGTQNSTHSFVECHILIQANDCWSQSGRILTILTTNCVGWH